MNEESSAFSSDSPVSTPSAPTEDCFVTAPSAPLSSSSSELPQSPPEPEMPTNSQPTSQTDSQQAPQPTVSSNSPSNHSFSRKQYIAAFMLCALLGGMIGSLLTIAVFSTRNSSSHSQYAPLISVSGDISPVRAIAAANMPTVVSIVNASNITYNTFFGPFTQKASSSGSGVIISTNGYIVTNYHVIENAQKLTVTLYDGRVYDAKIIGGDAATDLAVLQIDADGLTVANFGDSSVLAIGDMVVAIGNPLDAQAFAWTVTDGIVSGLDRTVKSENQTFTLIQTNAAINAGNSGGALLNSRGELIGINSLKISGESIEGMGFAIPVNDAKPIIEQLINQGYVSRPYLGIAGYDITPELLQQIRLPRQSGIWITQINADSPAEHAQLNSGDILYRVNDTDINTFADLSTVLQSHAIGDTLHLSVLRNGQSQMISIQIGEQAPAD